MSDLARRWIKCRRGYYAFRILPSPGMYMCHLLFQSLFKNQGLPDGGGINVFAAILHTHLAGNLQLILMRAFFRIVHPS